VRIAAFRGSQPEDWARDVFRISPSSRPNVRLQLAWLF
jgi:hypothetical protein